eukprot:908045-Pelagomonas_calceolata.AAC.1
MPFLHEKRRNDKTRGKKPSSMLHSWPTFGSTLHSLILEKLSSYDPGGIRTFWQPSASIAASMTAKPCAAKHAGTSVSHK